MLTYVNPATPTKDGNKRDMVRCACGRIFVIRKSWWTSGKVKSCRRCA